MIFLLNIEVKVEVEEVGRLRLLEVEEADVDVGCRGCTRLNNVEISTEGNWERAADACFTFPLCILVLLLLLLLLLILLLLMQRSICRLISELLTSVDEPNSKQQIGQTTEKGDPHEEDKDDDGEEDDDEEDKDEEDEELEEDIEVTEEDEREDSKNDDNIWVWD